MNKKKSIFFGFLVVLLQSVFGSYIVFNSLDLATNIEFRNPFMVTTIFLLLMVCFSLKFRNKSFYQWGIIVVGGFGLIICILLLGYVSRYGPDEGWEAFEAMFVKFRLLTMSISALLFTIGGICGLYRVESVASAEEISD